LTAALLVGNEDLRPHAEPDRQEIRSASAANSGCPCVHAAACG
jgi:hypothetical protein